MRRNMFGLLKKLQESNDKESKSKTNTLQSLRDSLDFCVQKRNFERLKEVILHAQPDHLEHIAEKLKKIYDPVEAINFIMDSYNSSMEHKISLLNVMINSGPFCLHFSNWISTNFPVGSGLMNPMQLQKLSWIFTSYSSPNMEFYLQKSMDYKNMRDILDPHIVLSIDNIFNSQNNKLFVGISNVEVCDREQREV